MLEKLQKEERTRNDHQNVECMDRHGDLAGLVVVFRDDPPADSPGGFASNEQRVVLHHVEERENSCGAKN